ncbi:response regulator [Pseudovibrio sp. SCP19]|uniref:response regulator n=1 Tax=Pseudovibrio sp. SCP19 TaxID=3141374 RepID=UPI003335A400
MNIRKTRILVVEDEAISRKKLVAYLQTEGFDVLEAADAGQMHQALEEFTIDLVLLDINLPDDDGINLARALRAQSDIGIILVTGRTDEIDRIIGIEVGADDYITKPYNPRELLARVKALLRRSGQVQPSKDEAHAHRFGRWTLNLMKRELIAEGEEGVALTRGEFQLLNTFTSKPGTVLSRDYLMDHISHRSWSPNDRSIDVLVGRLRKILEDNPRKPTMILTSHGEGYIFAESVEAL